MKPKSKTRLAGLLFAIVAVAAIAVGAVVFVQSRTAEADKNGAGESASASASAAAITDPSASTGESTKPDRSTEATPPITARPRNAAERLAFSLSPVQRERLLKFINEGSPKELSRIHGVGKTRAEAIESARPFETVSQLANVNGVGAVTFANVVEFGKTLEDRDAVVAVAAPSVR